MLTEFSWFRTEVSEHEVVLILGLLGPWRWREHAPPKRCPLFISRHGYISRKTWMLNFMVFKMCGISLPAERLSVSRERSCTVKLVCH